MGDCDSSDFDVITVKESETTPPPSRTGLTNIRKARWDSLVKLGEVIWLLPSLVRHSMSSLWSTIKSASNRAFLLRDLIFNRRSFKQVSDV